MGFVANLSLGSVLFGVATTWFLHKAPQRGDVWIVSETLYALAVFTGVYMQNSNLMSSLSTSALTVAIHLTTIAIVTVLYRISPFHPLARYPGPIINKATSLASAYAVLTGKRHLISKDLHERYGPFVRNGPNSLSINVHEAIKPIYASSSAFDKSNAYTWGRMPGKGLFFIKPRADHVQRRKVWAPAFSATALSSYMPVLQRRIDQFLEHAVSRQNGNGGVLDLSTLLNHFMYDIMGDITFSNSSTLELMKTGDPNNYCHSAMMSMVLLETLGEAPSLMDLLWYLPVGKAMRIYQATARQLMDVRAAAKTDFIDFAAHFLGESDATAKNPRLSIEDLYQESLFAIQAGTEATAGILTYIFFHVVGDPAVHARLCAELDHAYPTAGSQLDDAILKELPYFNAVIEESLRCGSPFPGLPRVTPPEGAVIAGEYVPGESIVSVPPWAQTQSTENFYPDPETFRPERWLPGGLGPDTHTRAGAIMTWSFGPFGCMGIQLAKQELRMVAARLFRDFHVKYAPGFDSQDFLDKAYNMKTSWFGRPFLVTLVPRQ